jgi:predicted small integral membrane protein
MIRLTKIAAAVFIGAIGLLFFLDNLFNLASAYSVTSFVVSGAEQPFYKILGPTVSASWLTWLSLFTIMGGELAVGILGFLGVFKMIKARSESQDSFNTAKTYTIAAGALGMIVWYGFFVVIGEGYFHMWQTETGLASIEGAFRYGTVCAVLMFYIGSKNDYQT